MVPEFFKMVRDIAVGIKPDVFLMFCPCGETYSFYTMPYYNVPIASDPESSWQVRSKGKVFKALMGPIISYHGDHVELSDKGIDFASTIGIGGVPDTKFTWPYDVKAEDGTYMDDEKEKLWKKWLDIYKLKMLSKGNYLGGLYTIGFDLPEAHAISKDGCMYYAFYAERWDGVVELRGLEDKYYSLYDYVQDRSMGIINGPCAGIDVFFEGYQLLEAKPVKG
jgi:alpha-galactosidase